MQHVTIVGERFLSQENFWIFLNIFKIKKETFKYFFRTYMHVHVIMYHFLKANNSVKLDKKYTEYNKQKIMELEYKKRRHDWISENISYHRGTEIMYFFLCILYNTYRKWISHFTIIMSKG